MDMVPNTTRFVRAPTADPLIVALERALQTEGLFAALRVLNEPTPYCMTGVYRFDAGLVKSVALFDRRNPHLRIGVDVLWEDSYCRMTADDGSSCEIADALADPRLTMHAAREAVQSYVAVLLKTPGGGPLGTLCHYDMRPTQPPPRIFEQLQAARPAIERALIENGWSDLDPSGSTRESPETFFQR